MKTIYFSLLIAIAACGGSTDGPSLGTQGPQGPKGDPGAEGPPGPPGLAGKGGASADERVTFYVVTSPGGLFYQYYGLYDSLLDTWCTPTTIDGMGVCLPNALTGPTAFFGDAECISKPVTVHIPTTACGSESAPPLGFSHLDETDPCAQKTVYYWTASKIAGPVFQKHPITDACNPYTLIPTAEVYNGTLVNVSDLAPISIDYAKVLD